MSNNTIKLELTVEEANVILAGLGQQPYIKVAELIQKIQKQAASQIETEGINGNVENIETAKIGAEDGQ